MSKETCDILATTLLTIYIHLHRTFLVSTNSFSSKQQLDCLNNWISKTNEIIIAGVASKVCMLLQR